MAGSHFFEFLWRIVLGKRAYGFGFRIGLGTVKRKGSIGLIAERIPPPFMDYSRSEASLLIILYFLCTALEVLPRVEKHSL